MTSVYTCDLDLKDRKTMSVHHTLAHDDVTKLSLATKASIVQTRTPE